VREHPEVAAQLAELLKQYRKQGRSSPRSQRASPPQTKLGQAATEASTVKQPNFVKEMLKYIDAFEKDLAENGRQAGWVENPVPLTKR